MKGLGFVTILLHFGLMLHGQTDTSIKFPVMQQFKPLVRSSAPSVQPQKFQHPNKQIALGMNSNSVLEQANRQSASRMGAVYIPKNTSLENARKINDAHIRQQTNTQFNQPSVENGFRQSQGFADAIRQIDLLNKVASTDTYLSKTKYYSSKVFVSSVPSYEKAFNSLSQMLEGKKELSLKDAFYSLENSFGNLHLSYDEYSEQLTKSATFIKELVVQSGLDVNNQESYHWGIQKFMGDTASIKLQNLDNAISLGQSQTHLPFIYDYVESLEMKDFRDYFVTKTLATGSGQCHTLPSVYLLLAEQLNVNANLSCAPQHSFIRYKNSQGIQVNYEPTADWHFTDQDYLKERPIMAKAIANGFYLNTMSKKEIIASLMIELAHSYYRRNWIGDGQFIRKCVSVGEKHLNNGLGNQQSQILLEELYALEFDRQFRGNGLKSLDEISRNPDVLRAFNQYKSQAKRYRELGLQDHPDEMYLKILEKYDKREKMQLAKGVNTKAKRDLFINY